MTRVRSASDGASRWIPVLCRAAAVALTAYPAARKFLQYSDRVSQFETWGFPFPELAVPFSGVVEVVAIASLAFGIAGRLGAITLGATMIVALVTAGPNVCIGLVLGSSVVVAVLGTGPYSYCDPTLADLAKRAVPSRGTPREV